MQEPTFDELQEARRPIDSLISKSNNAQQKLSPGTWQYRMMEDNLRALRIASTLMDERPGEESRYEVDDLKHALQTMAKMIGQVEKTQAKFARGTSQHTLQRNRLKALRVAEALTMAAMSQRDG